MTGNLLIDFSIVVVASILVMMGLAAWWAFFDAWLAEYSEWQTARRRRWVWMLTSAFIPFAGVYYLLVVREQVRGKPLPIAVTRLVQGYVVIIAIVFGIPLALIAFSWAGSSLSDNPTATAAILASIGLLALAVMGPNPSRRR